jgi:N-carbamoyl-L-amino-acid hydrolase
VADLDALAQVGATADGGVHRPALSDADLQARRWLRARAEGDGFEVRQDGCGNVSALLLSSDPEAQVVMCGSHLDSVPNGGRFDGALGVVAALEVLRTIREAGLSLPHHVEAMSFTDEEGTWAGLLGSRALAGHLTPDEIENPRGDLDEFHARLAAAGLTPDGVLRARRSPASIRAWLEVHIEQGRA